MKKKDNGPLLRFSCEIVTPFRRFLSGAGDLFSFYIIVALIFMLGIFPLTKATPSFKNSLAIQEKALENCRDIYIDGHLMYLDSSGEALSKEEIVTKYIKSKLELNDYVSENYSDMFYYFYLTYASNNLTVDDVELTYDDYYLKDTIFDLAHQEAPILWDAYYDGPVRLTSEAKAKIEQYMSGDRTLENTQYYKKISEFCQNNLVEAEKIVKNSDQYKTNYASVMKENLVLYYHITVSSTITYTVFFFLYYLLVPALFKDGQSFLKRVLRIKVVDRNNNGIQFKTLLVRSIMQYISYSFLTLFIPYLILGSTIFNLPMITIAGSTINLFIFAILTFVLTIASLIFTFVSKYNQTLVDKVMDTYCLDLNKDLPVEDLEENNKDGSSI